MSNKERLLVISIGIFCGALLALGLCVGGCTTMVKTAQGLSEGAILDAQYAFTHLKDGTKKAENNVRNNDAVLRQGYSD